MRRRSDISSSQRKFAVAEELKLMPITAENRAASYSPRTTFHSKEVSHALKQRDGELLVCDVSLYYQLYGEHLQKSGGSHEIAQKYTLLAAKKDGVALIQENISALSIDKTPIFDLESRARMQLTPTVNTYLLHQEEVFDQESGSTEIQKKMVSPEHAYIGRSVKRALSRWRRSNDLVSMTQNEEIFTNLDDLQKTNPDFDPTKTVTLAWGSPIASEAEGSQITEFNGEYGYWYIGRIVQEAGLRKMIVHSYKNDMSAEAYYSMMKSLGGREFFAGLDDQSTPQTELVDRVMRSSILVEGELTDQEIFSRMFEAKKQIDNSETMFGITKETLLAVQDPELRQRLEDEASMEVGSWLVSQIAAGVDQRVVQTQIKDRYILATQKTLTKIQTECKLQEMLKKSADITDIGISIVDEKRVDLTDLAKMKANQGKACGGWGKSSSATVIEDSSQQLVKALGSYTSFSGSGWGIGGGGSSFESSEMCKDCGLRPKVKSGCGWCEPCGNKH